MRRGPGNHVSGCAFELSGFELRFQFLGFGLGFGASVSGFGFRVSGFGGLVLVSVFEFRVSGFGSRVSGVGFVF